MEKNKKFLAIFSLIVFTLLFCLYTNHNNIEKNGIKTIKYRTYSNEKWSLWSKNGKKIKKDTNIKKIEIRTKIDAPTIFYYYDNKWHTTNSNNDIYGIRIINTANVLKKYSFCYRTYNKKDGWLNWACNGEKSGNINSKIENIQIKIIPKGVIKDDFLHDYIENKNDINIGFDGV